MNVTDFCKFKLRLLSSRCLKQVVFEIAFKVSLRQQILDNII